LKRKWEKKRKEKEKEKEKEKTNISHYTLLLHLYSHTVPVFALPVQNVLAIPKRHAQAFHLTPVATPEVLPGREQRVVLIALATDFLQEQLDSHFI
jgi:hypothetical protein